MDSERAHAAAARTSWRGEGAPGRRAGVCGYTVMHTSAMSLSAALACRQAEGVLSERLAFCAKSTLPIVHELGYLLCGALRARHLAGAQHLSVGDWGGSFGAPSSPRRFWMG